MIRAWLAVLGRSMIELILGGARSGKSRHALHRLHPGGCGIFTAQALDQEMSERIARHRLERPANFIAHEQPLALAESLARLRGQAVLVDCLTLWLSNCLHHNCYQQQREALVAELEHWQSSGQLLLVSNEVGQGIIPLGQLTRQFVDQQGWLNQSLAQLAQQVTLICAGLPLSLKSL